MNDEFRDANPRLGDLPSHPLWEEIQADPLDPAFYLSPEELALLHKYEPDKYEDPFKLYANTAELLDADLAAYTDTVFGVRDDGFALLYPGCHATIYGEPGSGKTLFAKYVSSQAINDGKRVLHVDVDGNFGAVIVQDVHAFGTQRDALIKNYRLAQPDSIGPLIDTIRDAQANPFDLVVLDSIASLQAYTGADGDKATEFVQRVYQAFIAPLMAVGSTVLTIDHTGKDDSVRGAAGSVQKMAKADLAFRAVPKGTGLQRGRDGRIDLMLEKDRYSSVKAASMEATGGAIHAAMFTIPASGMLDAKIKAPDGAITPGSTPRSKPSQDEALDALANASKPLSWQEWQAKTALSPDSFRHAVKRLLDSGQVENNAAGIYAVRRVAT